MITKLWEQSGNFSPKRRWVVEIERSVFAKDIHNHRLYQDLISSSSTADNLMALVLVARATEVFDMENARLDLRASEKENAHLRERCSGLQKQLERISHTMFPDETRNFDYRFSNKAPRFDST